MERYKKLPYVSFSQSGLCTHSHTDTQTYRHTGMNKNVQECRNPHHKHTTIGSFVTAGVSAMFPSTLQTGTRHCEVECRRKQHVPARPHLNIMFFFEVRLKHYFSNCSNIFSWAISWPVILCWMFLIFKPFQRVNKSLSTGQGTPQRYR